MSVFTNPSSGAAEHASKYITAVLDLLGDRDPIDVLREMPDVMAKALSSLSGAQAVKPEAPGKWSVRDVLQHLADSELVLAVRMRMILAQDRPPLVGYDQDLWAARLHYERSDAKQALQDFTMLRRANLRLLDSASADDLQRVGVHAERGPNTLYEMVRLGAGHDLVHVNQVERIRAAVS